MTSEPRPAAAGGALEARLAALEAAESIRALKARYASLADAKYTKLYRRQPDDVMRRVAWEQAACFTEDAVWEGGAEFGENLVGRARLFEWFMRSPWCFAVHYYASPVLHVEGDRATGHWRLWQMALRADTREAVLVAAVTSEAYVKAADGAWLHSRVRFEEIHMLPISAGPDPLAATFQALSARRIAE